MDLKELELGMMEKFEPSYNSARLEKCKEEASYLVSEINRGRALWIGDMTWRYDIHTGMYNWEEGWQSNSVPRSIAFESITSDLFYGREYRFLFF